MSIEDLAREDRYIVSKWLKKTTHKKACEDKISSRTFRKNAYGGKDIKELVMVQRSYWKKKVDVISNEGELK
ncbi:hypothetical protein KI387_029768, partial [Taxus chinensis]